MKATNNEADSMLRSWGSWVRGGSTLLLPKRNILDKLRREGAGASHSTVAGEPHMPWYVEIVERCVLSEMSKPIRRVCMHRYVGNEPDHIARKKLKLTQGEYEQRINQACHTLANFLIEN